MEKQTFEDFKKAVNDKRKSGGKYGKWYYHTANVDGNIVELKGFKTWLQIFRINGMNYPGGMDIPVGAFNKHLEYVTTKEVTK
ncbi:MAG: hypothetical protein M0P69_11440 [Bacteroidales bacterium]|nr:hypothetical protein [Bacteroidales bacterium]